MSEYTERVNPVTGQVQTHKHRGGGKHHPKRAAHLPHKTVDPEFDLKYEECMMVESHVQNIQRMFRNFYKNAGGKQ